MGTKVYNADEVTLTIGGSLIDSGYADGAFLSIEQTAEQVQSVAGTDGEVAISRIRDKRAKVTIRLMQTSLGNDLLSAKHNNAMKGPGSPSLGAFYVRDRNGNAIYEAPACWIVKPPTVEYDRTATAREWELGVDVLDRQDGGNNDAASLLVLP